MRSQDCLCKLKGLQFEPQLLESKEQRVWLVFDPIELEIGQDGLPENITLHLVTSRENFHIEVSLSQIPTKMKTLR